MGDQARRSRPQQHHQQQRDQREPRDHQRGNRGGGTGGDRSSRSHQQQQQRSPQQPTITTATPSRIILARPNEPSVASSSVQTQPQQQQQRQQSQTPSKKPTTSNNSDGSGGASTPTILLKTPSRTTQQAQPQILATPTIKVKLPSQTTSATTTAAATTTPARGISSSSSSSSSSQQPMLAKRPSDSILPSTTPQKQPLQSVPSILSSTTKSKFMDRNLEFRQDISSKLFSETNTDYLVVGVVGRQGSGKSTLLSSLINSDEPNIETSKFPFPPQSWERYIKSRHETFGVDCYVTSDRTIYLDTQPIFSSSVVYETIEERHRCECGELESQFLNFLVFLYSVCDVLLITQNQPIDMGMWRMLHIARLISCKLAENSFTSHRSANIRTPKSSTVEIPTNCAENIFVFNRLPVEYFSENFFAEVRQCISILCPILKSERPLEKPLVEKSLERGIPLNSFHFGHPKMVLIPISSVFIENLANQKINHDAKKKEKNEADLPSSSSLPSTSSSKQKAAPMSANSTNSVLNAVSANLRPNTYSSSVRLLKNMILETPIYRKYAQQQSYQASAATPPPPLLTEKDWYRNCMKKWDIICESDYVNDYAKALRMDIHQIIEQNSLHSLC